MIVTPRTTVIARMSSRRRWTIEQKLAVVAASYEPGARVQDVADRFEVSPAQIYNWRRHGSTRSAERPAIASFARVEVAGDGAPRTEPWARSSMIEIRLGCETNIVVDADVNEGVLRRVLAALGR